MSSSSQEWTTTNSGLISPDQVHPSPEGLHYLQQHGTAMGTHMAPSYANLFMGKLEQMLLQTQHRAPLVWWRCVDDILAIWTHGEAALQEVLASLNQYHTTIKFTSTWSAEEVTFRHMRAYRTIRLRWISRQAYRHTSIPPNHQLLFKTMHDCHHLRTAKHCHSAGYAQNRSTSYNWTTNPLHQERTLRVVDSSIVVTTKTAWPWSYTHVHVCGMCV